MFFYERAEMEKKRLTAECNFIREKLGHAPDGMLRCKKQGDGYKWLYSAKDNCGRVKYSYLRRSELKKARELARKTYYLQKQRDNEREIAALDAYLKRCVKDGGKSTEVKKHPAFSELLQAGDLERELAEWKAAPYEKNPHHEEHLKVRAMNGEMVRSKSEAFILSSLAAADIPVRYECKLQLGDAVYYPDFTIRRPSDGQIILWEHFGLMSEYGYMKTAQEKIRTYIAYGFYPMEKLITTFEHEKSTLDFSRVMEIVEWLRG